MGLLIIFLDAESIVLLIDERPHSHDLERSVKGEVV